MRFLCSLPSNLLIPSSLSEGDSPSNCEAIVCEREARVMLGDSPEERSASPSTNFDRLSNRPGTEGREKKMERKWLYEVMYNNVLLPRRRDILKRDQI